jgi:hypothetical protein
MTVSTLTTCLCSIFQEAAAQRAANVQGKPERTSNAANSVVVQ